MKNHSKNDSQRILVYYVFVCINNIFYILIVNDQSQRFDNWQNNKIIFKFS